ncbi:MAG: lytic transglycosylase domain-containing protein [Clostridia bacterium]|nr:lytic transglycosylase domain-containing protein [Clostridia bacterium]
MNGKTRGCCGCGCGTYIFVIILMAACICAAFHYKDQILEFFYPRDYEETISANCEEYRVDKWLVMALIREESSFNPDAVSGAGAHGLMQLMPATAEWLIGKGGFDMSAADALHAPGDNIRLGVYYLSLLFASYGKDGPLTDPAIVIAAYNAGIGSVDAWLAEGIWDGSEENLSDIPYAETRRHVEHVLRSWRIYQKLYQ